MIDKDELIRKIKDRLEGYRNNKFYRWGGIHPGYSQSLKRQIQSAIDELEWILEQLNK